MNLELCQHIEDQLQRSTYLRAGVLLRTHVHNLFGGYLYISELTTANDLSDEQREMALPIMKRLKEIVRDIYFVLRGNEHDALIYAIQALVSDTSLQAERFLQKHGILDERAREEFMVITSISREIGNAFKTTI